MDYAKIIWDILKAAGFTDIEAAGIMGNLYGESGIIPNNLQNTYNTKFGMTDVEYTNAVDKGTYTKFVTDSAGYGIAQWTNSTRKKNLLDYAKATKKSIGDINMQGEFLVKEIKGMTAVMNGLKAASTVRAASDVVLQKFEIPAKLATAAEEEKRAATRASYGMMYYNKYASSTTTTTTVSTVAFSPRTTAPSTTDAYWKHTSAGGKNECILIANGSCIPNCVGYAWGRFYEIIGKRPTLSRANAENWYGYIADGYKRSKTPALGAVACWAKGKVGVASDGAGHVAIVEEIKANGDIVTSNSGYNSTRFWMQTFTKASGYSMNGYTFQGFILPPDATPIADTGTTTPATTTVNYLVKVTATNLNVRSKPGTNNPLTGSIKDQGVYTIVEESAGAGASMWGKLKSGLGWISLDYVKKL
ncbi:MAG: phage tail tip lysozyme [Roseburia sp.]|nr:phage tail tip lysozyme [Roseburia sp.]